MFLCFCVTMSDLSLLLFDDIMKVKLNFFDHCFDDDLDARLSYFYCATYFLLFNPCKHCQQLRFFRRKTVQVSVCHRFAPYEIPYCCMFLPCPIDRRFGIGFVYMKYAKYFYQYLTNLLIHSFCLLLSDTCYLLYLCLIVFRLFIFHTKGANCPKHSSFKSFGFDFSKMCVK